LKKAIAAAPRKHGHHPASGGQEPPQHRRPWILAARLDRNSLPIVWDADFLYGPRIPSGEDTYVLCGINISSVFAMPDEAPAAIARLAVRRLQQRG
jgi:hypothetical protein